MPIINITYYLSKKEMQNQFELKSEVAKLSTKLERLGVPKGNGVIRPNKGRFGMLSDGPNKKKKSNGKKKLGLAQFHYLDLGDCGRSKEMGHLHLKWVLCQVLA